MNVVCKFFVPGLGFVKPKKFSKPIRMTLYEWEDFQDAGRLMWVGDESSPRVLIKGQLRPVKLKKPKFSS